MVKETSEYRCTAPCATTVWQNFSSLGGIDVWGRVLEEAHVGTRLD